MKTQIYSPFKGKDFWMEQLENDKHVEIFIENTLNDSNLKFYNEKFMISDFTHDLIKENVDYMIHLSAQKKRARVEYLDAINRLDRARQYHEQLKKEAITELTASKDKELKKNQTKK